jgi:PAS domain S-box-containing protein
MVTQLPSISLLIKLFDSLNEILCILNKEGEFIYINEACSRLWGYEPDDLAGQNFFDLVVEEDRVASIMVATEAYTNGTISTIENRIRRKDGSVVTMFWEGGWNIKEQLLYSIGKDISEQRRIEELEREHQQALEKAHNRLSLLLERITDGFLGLDHNAQVIYWNKAAEEMLSVSRHEIVGKELWSIFPADAKEKIIQRYHEVKERKEPVRMQLYFDCMQQWFEVNSYVSGTGLSVYFRDITEKRKLRKALLFEREQQRKRIATAVIATTEKERSLVGKELHDNINQVLTTIKLYTELCLVDPSKTELLLRRSTQLLQSSIDEIRGLSKRLSGPSLGVISLHESIAELVESVNATKRLMVVYENTGEKQEVNEVVHTAIYRILQEQFTNILKHAEATEVIVRLIHEPAAIRLIVRDNGKGFDILQKRTGIGVENMIMRTDALKGKLKLNSAPGRGCRLEVTMPFNRQEE